MTIISTTLFDTDVVMEVLTIIEDGKGRWTPSWTAIGTLKGRFTGTKTSSSVSHARDNRDATGSFHCSSSELDPSVPGYIRENRRIRLKYDTYTEVRYFEVIGMPVDKGERKRQTRFSIIERDANWIGNE